MPQKPTSPKLQIHRQRQHNGSPPSIGSSTAPTIGAMSGLDRVIPVKATLQVVSQHPDAPHFVRPQGCPLSRRSPLRPSPDAAGHLESMDSCSTRSRPGYRLGSDGRRLLDDDGMGNTILERSSLWIKERWEIS